MLCGLLRSFHSFNFCITLLLSFTTSTLAQNVVNNGPALPLAVKSPYLNTWIPGGGLAPRTALFNPGPTIWSTTAVPPLDWSCSVCFWNTTNADGSPNCGDGVVVMKEANATSNLPPLLLSNITFVLFTPTRTSYLIQVGSAELNVTFLTPVTPTDLTRQSLPFSYLFITATNSPNAPQGGGVRVYTDITAAQWLSGGNVNANASSIIDSELVILASQLVSPQPFVEIDERPQDGTAFYATKAGSNVRYQVGLNVPVRTLAMNGTGLQDLVDQTYGSRPLNEPQVDVFGISFDQPNSGQTGASPLLWAVGLTRDPSIQFTSLNGSSEMRSDYFWSNFSTPRDAISFFLDDFDNALAGAQSFDAQLLSAANAYSTEYADLVALTARQAMSALEFTVSKDSSGAFDTSDVQIFVKDLGDIASGGVNAVDVLYAALPMYLYLNAEIVGMALKPLLEAQNDPLYNLPYAAQNLGTGFPTATIQNEQHNFGIEQSGNMLIMSLAHAQATGDGSLIGQHYDLLKNWTEYLVENSLNPGGQQTSRGDNILSSNQTNLALKGILGIGAMARMSSFAGIKDDETRYQNISQSYMEHWTTLAVSSDKSRLLGTFGNETSNGMIYNLYADKLLQLQLVPQSIYDIQTSFYETQLASRKFGLSLDSGNPALGRVDWTMFAASVVSNSDVGTKMIAQVHAYTFNAAFQSGPLSTVYDPTQGTPKGGSNSPALGAIFSLLALQKPIQNLTVSVDSNSSNGGGGESGSSSANSPHKNNIVGIVVGAVIGGVAAIFPAIFYYLYRKRRDRKETLERRESLRRMEPLSVRTGATTQITTAASSRSHLVAPQVHQEEQQQQRRLRGSQLMNADHGALHANADSKAMRAREQFVTFGGSTESERQGPSSRVDRSLIFPASSEVVESPTEAEEYSEDARSSASSYSTYTAQDPDAVSPVTNRTTSSEVWRMRGQLANLMREVARIREERLPPSGLRVVIPGSSLEMDAPPLYEEGSQRNVG